MRPERPSGPRFDVSMAEVNWWYPDGSTVTSCPLELSMAEAVARAYVERYPERRSWLSVPAMLRHSRRDC
jgi:hypothetical protein